MSRFYEIEPTSENYWRAIILFGRNTASYKFALAKALLDIQRQGKDVITLEELAVPYAHHICEHLKISPKQSTRESGVFLNELRRFNAGEITESTMLAQTLTHGFNYVLDAFHNVHGNQVATRFFIDERKGNGTIRLTDEFVKLGEAGLFADFEKEVESRWRLVESAWENNMPRNLMRVEYDQEQQILMGFNSLKRINVTPARSALNGYQKGRCFYCFRSISVADSDEHLADVDHFFPHMLKQCDNTKPIDGVANLVLACRECNRGSSGKFEKLPSVNLLDRLFNRNEYLITSHHPLRETLIAQTGTSTRLRQNYLQEAYNCSTLFVGATGQKWEPKPQGIMVF